MCVEPYYDVWQGQYFDTKPHGDVRLLLVGESSYERDEKSLPDHLRADTQYVADGTFSARYSGFWRFIQRSVTGVHEINLINQSEFWHGVALANLVQRPMSCKNSRPNDGDYAQGAMALMTYVERIRPTAVILYSKEGWSVVRKIFSLISDTKTLAASDTLPSTLADCNICWSSRVLGSASPLFLLARHPSARPKTSGTSWHKLVAPFIQRARHSGVMRATCETHVRDSDC